MFKLEKVKFSAEVRAWFSALALLLKKLTHQPCMIHCQFQNFYIPFKTSMHPNLFLPLEPYTFQQGTSIYHFQYTFPEYKLTNPLQIY